VPESQLQTLVLTVVCVLSSIDSGPLFVAYLYIVYRQVFEPSLDALSLRSDGISSIKILSVKAPSRSQSHGTSIEGRRGNLYPG